MISSKTSYQASGALWRSLATSKAYLTAITNSPQARTFDAINNSAETRLWAELQRSPMTRLQRELRRLGPSKMVDASLRLAEVQALTAFRNSPAVKLAQTARIIAEEQRRQGEALLSVVFHAPLIKESHPCEVCQEQDRRRIGFRKKWQ